MAGRKVSNPLNDQRLDELALRYVGRFATSRAKLRTYLARKLRERGWAGDGAADLDAVVARLARLGYVDDQGYALAKARALTGRGYGERRVADALRTAGIDADDGSAAREHARTEAVAAALRFAERRRIGPFATAPIDTPKERERLLAAMVRAGHGFALSKAIVGLRDVRDLDLDALTELAGRFD